MMTYLKQLEKAAAAEAAAQAPMNGGSISALMHAMLFVQ